MTVEKVLVKDSEGTFEGKLICFPGKVPDDLLCVVCKNISSKQLQDSQGHIYCEPCVYMLEDDGSIQWDIGDTTITTDMDQLTECNSAFNRALDLTAWCPNEWCTFKTSLRNLFDHYRRCQPAVIGTRACPLCSTEMHPRLLPDHISTQCENRILNCPYCSAEHTAINLKSHLDACELRPVTCEHCEEEFDTFVEFRDKHMDFCSRRPEKCPYEKIGCPFQGVAVEVQKHVSSSSDARLLMEAIAALTAKVEKLAEDNRRLTEDNRRLAEKVQNLEDKQKEEAYLRLNVASVTDELDEAIKNLRKQIAAPRKEPELEKRLEKLEQASGAYHKPLEELMKSIARL